MQDKTYMIRVEKSYRLLICTLWIIWSGCTIGVICFLENRWNIPSILIDIFALLMLISGPYLLYKIKPDLPVAQILQADFYYDREVLRKEKSSRTIYYGDISEVSKIMVINKTYSDKGYYRVKIKNKGKKYVIYSTADEYEKHLDFEQTELSRLYFEFKARGVKCC